MKAARSALLAAVLMAPAVAFAAIGVNKTFNPTNVSAGQSSTLTVILINNNPAAAIAAAFTDTLPASVVIATPANASTTCVGGTITATSGNGSFSFSGGTIPAAVGLTAGQCTVQVDVSSPSAGVYINTIPANAVTSSQGANTQAASATLTVAALRPVTGAKAFAPTNLHGGGTPSTVTLTLTNPNGVALTAAAFTDTLPVASLAIASTPNASTTCGAGIVTTTANTASLAGGTIPANGSCIVKFDVVAVNPNVYVDANVTNSIAVNALTTAQGVSNTAFSATVRLQTGARVEKSFVPTSITTGGTAALTVTVRNFNATPLGGIAFNDVLPGTMRVAAPVTAATTCTSLAFTPAPIAGDAFFTVSGGTLLGAPAGIANANCTVTINVTATNAGVNPVTLTNTIPVGNFGGVAFSSAGAGLIVTAVTSVGGSKAFLPAAILQGQTSTATITLTNSAAVVATITSFTDALTTMGANPQFTVAGAPTTTCGGAVTSSGPPLNTITLGAGNSIPAGGSCTITVPVQASAIATTGARTNTIAQGALVTSQGRTQTAITGALTVNPVLSAAKAFAPTTVAAGADTRMTITLTLAAGASSLSGLTFTDTLPAGHVVSATPNLINNCGGAVTATGGSVALAGGSLTGGAAASTCTILVNITTPAGAGAATNTIAAGAVTAAGGFTNPAAANATITRVVTNVTLNKSFSPATVLVSGVSTMTINVLNTNANALALTTTGLVDTLPGGMAIAAAPLPSNTCGGALTAVAGAGTVTLTGGNIAANATCSIQVHVVANASGNLINTLGAGAFTSAQGVTNPLAASATLAATGNADLSVTKTDGVGSVVPGASTTYTIVAKNNGPNNVAGAGVVDTPPAGMTFTGWTCVASAGSACNPSGSGPINELVTLQNGGTATFTVTAAIASTATGTITNTATVVVPGPVIDTVPGNNTASDTDTLTPRADLAITKTGTVNVNALGAITYTLTLSNAGPSSANGATFGDNVPPGVTGIAAVCGSALGGAVCPGSVSVAGNLVSGSIPTLPPGGSVVITVTGVAPTSGTLSNSATVTAPVGTTDPNLPNNTSATVVTTVNPIADVAIVKSGPPTVNAAGALTYTLTISNVGPSSANGATFGDNIPAGVTGIAASCGSALGGAVCPGSVSVVGQLVSGAIPTLPPGGSVVITITGTAPTSGTLANAATVAAPAGTTDPNLPNNTSTTVVTTVNPVADLSVTKSDGVGSVNAGGSTVYTIVVSNAGPSSADGAVFKDAAVPNLTIASVICGSPAGGAVCPTVPNTTIALMQGSGIVVPTLPATGSVTFTVNANIAAGATGTITNVATIAAPAGVTDTTPANNTATDIDTIVLAADLAITKTDGVTSVVPGNVTTYTIVVTNNGPSDVAGAKVADVMPTGIAGDTFTAVGSGGAAGFTVSGSGNINDTVDMPAGATVTYTVAANVASNATGALANTATVAAPAGVTDPVPGNNTATDSDTLMPQVTLVVAKTDGSLTYTPGGTATYLVTVTNTGASDAADLTVTDLLPSGLTLTANVSCTAIGSANCGLVVGSIGGISFGTTGAKVGAGLGNSLVFTVPVAFASGMITNPLQNTVTVTDLATGATAADMDSDNLAPQVTLAVGKTDGTSSYTPGGTAVYTVTITHGGLSDATDITVNDPLPAGVTLTANVSCVAIGAASCGAVTGATGQSIYGTTGAKIAAGAGNSLVFTAPVAFAPGMAADPLVNTATATDLLSGATGAGTDSDTRAALVTLAVTKDDGSPTYTPGGTATYLVAIANTGASDALNVSVDDLLPAGVVLNGLVTCAVTGSASCGTVTGSAPQTSFGAVSARIDAGAANSIKFTVPVSFASNLADNPLINTATTKDLASSATGSANDSDVLAAQADLSISKTDGVTSAVPGGTTTYTIVVANNGPSDVISATVSDVLPAAVASDTYTAAGSGGASGFTASGSGNINDTVDLPAGSTITYALVATISGSASGSLVNTATVTAPAGVTDTNSGNNSATDSDTLSAQADLAISKTDGVASAVPGGTTTYTIVVTNNGPSDVVGATVSDVLPSGITSATWTATATLGATGFTASGSGNINDTVNMPAGSTITYSLVANISASASGTLSNTATVTAPAGVTDSNPGNNSATDTDTLTAQADLAITKTDGVTNVSAPGVTTYTIVVTNNGPSAVVGATVGDALPAAIASAAFTATGTGGASGFTASGSGGINDTVNMPAGSTITYTLVANISGSASGTLSNTATVTAPGGVTDPNPGNNSATDTDTITVTPMADLGLTKTDGSATYTPGGAVTYTIVAGNSGPAGVNGATVADTLPAAITGATWTCVGALGGTCPPSGSGNINASVNLPAGASVTFTLTGNVTPSATGNLVNTATVSVPAGVVDPNPGNNSATDTDTPTAMAALAITKTDGSATYTPGGMGTYTITVTNNGLSNANAVSVTDNLPAGVTLDGNATCAASGIATCGTVTGSTGDGVFTTIGATIAAGGGNRLVFTLPVRFSGSLTTNPLVNTATALDPASATVASASDSDALLLRAVIPVPIDNRWTLSLLAGLILLVVGRKAHARALHRRIQPLPARAPLRRP